MPVLAREPFVLPEGLFATGRPLRPDGQTWTVLQTRPRAEKALARWLVRHDVSFFLPLHERRRRFQRRLVCSYVPLFPGYVFLLGDESAREIAFEMGSVAHCLAVPDQEQLDDDLTRVHGMIHSGAPLAPEARLQPGMAAEIVGGPLAGHRGTVIRRDGSLKFIIEVNFLQQGASVEVDVSMIRPI